jgi:ligand-binding SRPBCC domain-containing protein
MPTIEESITINRPVADIYAFMADGNNVAVYDSSCVRSEPESDGELAVGTRWRGATKVLGRQFDWVTECTELEPEKSVTFKAVEGKLPFEIHTQYTPDGEGTRLDYRIDAESGLGGVFGKFADPLVVKAQTRTVKANLATLKELLEDETG